VVEALRAYDRELDRLLASHAPLQAVRQQLHFRTLLAVNDAYYQVREAETQAFYGLLRAEMDAAGLDDLLRRFIVILTRTFHAQAGRMIPLTNRPPIASRVLKRLARPRYIAAGSRDEELVLDRAMRGVFQSYWSIPFFADRVARGSSGVIAWLRHHYPGGRACRNILRTRNKWKDTTTKPRRRS
jgi:hypothetical protein